MELACATHPAVETRLSCGRCGRPVCVKCVLATEVGTRCRTCLPAAPVRFGRATAVERFPGWSRPAAAVLAVLVCAGAVGYSWMEGDRDRLIIRAIVLGGGVASLVAHELAHGLVAYWGGDRSVRGRGYLTLNPLKFMDPMLSIALPLFFLLLGGVPIMGGRTFIDRSQLRSPGWSSAVSAAGPGANLLIALVIGFVLRNQLVDPYGPVGVGLAFLALIEVVLGLFNLIPVPGLDGYGVIEPMLDIETRAKLRPLAYGGGYFLVLAVMFMVPGAAAWLWSEGESVIGWLGIDPIMAELGGYYARLIHW